MSIRRDVDVSVLLVYLPPTYFVLRLLALGEGDAAGEGLAAGLEPFAGTLPAALPGEADVDGDGLIVLGALELLSGSVAQPDAYMIENIVRSRSAVRLIMFMFGVIISSFASFRKIEKRDDDCPSAN